MKVDYSQLGVAPEEYKCSNCGVTGIKLWRDAHSMAFRLFCALCSARLQGKNIDDINELGRYTTKRGYRSDQIGWYIPALPMENEFQGYTGWYKYGGMPPAGVAWWESLPTKQ